MTHKQQRNCIAATTELQPPMNGWCHYIAGGNIFTHVYDQLVGKRIQRTYARPYMNMNTHLLFAFYWSIGWDMAVSCWLSVIGHWIFCNWQFWNFCLMSYLPAGDSNSNFTHTQTHALTCLCRRLNSHTHLPTHCCCISADLCVLLIVFSEFQYTFRI